MMIRELFDQTKDLDRTIEKVISYGATQEERLKAEISEYVVTESIDEQFRKLLDRMQLAMEVGGENEIGVWVSGFYGSGKNSFTKYLGFAFDDQCRIDGTPFLNHLQDRLRSQQTKSLLSVVAKRYPAAIVMLDLASEMLAGATMEDVSTVLYFKVLQWAGYSRNLKVAAFERMAENDGRAPELHERVAQAFPGTTWDRIPSRPGDKIKTDRRDSQNLAILHRSGHLTAVWVPDEVHEAMRDLVRARTRDAAKGVSTTPCRNRLSAHACPPARCADHRRRRFGSPPLP